MKRLLAALFLVLLPALALAAGQPVELSDPTNGYRATVNSDGTQAVSASPIPSGAVSLNAASGNVANASAAATLGAASGKTTYICGFSMTSTGSTAAAVVSPTITNLIGGTATFTYASVAGVTLANQSLVVSFNPCIPANATNTSIVVTLPALGAGNTNATTNAWGYRF